MIIANILQCTLEKYTPVHTANINNSVHCACMYGNENGRYEWSSVM